MSRRLLLLALESVRTLDYSFPKPGTTEPAAKQLQARIDNQRCGVAYY
jgi:hypothetical protein